MHIIFLFLSETPTHRRSGVQTGYVYKIKQFHMELVSIIGTIHLEHNILSSCQLHRYWVCKKGHGCDSRHLLHSNISSQIL